uniref:Putative secreted salivary protein n=1 Tax=Ixodes scapularis TaxID=6945 RepID=Q4PMM8_IXOSC|nr:putative secreted salivary protein [Ixodes scapularis]
MRATTLILMAVSLLITANLVGTCIHGNNAYYEAANKYCNKKCSGRSDCDWPCEKCQYNAYQGRKRCV